MILIKIVKTVKTNILIEIVATQKKLKANVAKNLGIVVVIKIVANAVETTIQIRTVAIAVNVAKALKETRDLEDELEQWEQWVQWVKLVQLVQQEQRVTLD
ncbi:MAG TPA: hypothetical protein VLQ66_10840 [Paenisporosarcina sp.]|nr:hypothetical protein [Paenisporosarcina sp.]